MTRKFKMPSAGKLLNLVVKCEGAPGSGKTFTWKAQHQWHPRAALGMLLISDSATTCEDYDPAHADDFDADDLVTFKVTTTGGTATARDCVIGVQVAGAGEATPLPTPDHSLILFGDATAVEPSGDDQLRRAVDHRGDAAAESTDREHRRVHRAGDRT